jgi:hypothetical protein
VKSKSTKKSKPFEWGKPLYVRKNAAISNTIVDAEPGMLRGGTDNQEAFDQKGPGLRNPQSFPVQRADHLTNTEDIVPLHCELKPKSFEESIQDDLKALRERDARIRKSAQSDLTTAKIPKTPFEKDAQREVEWRRRVEAQTNQPVPTITDTLLALHDHPIFGDCLSPAEWSLWALHFVFGMSLEVLSLHESPSPTDDGLPGADKLQQRLLECQTTFLQKWANADASTIQSALDAAHAKLVARAKWYVDFRYPKPTATEIQARQAAQRMALPELGLDPHTNEIISIWIDCEWCGRETARRLEGEVSAATVARIIRTFVDGVRQLQKTQHSVALDAFTARVLSQPDIESELEKDWAYEAALALADSPKVGESWGAAFGGASIHNTFHHREGSFNRWGGYQVGLGSHVTESHRGTFWDDFSEESSA